jgi:K+-transporting ATPase ATPase C chain
MSAHFRGLAVLLVLTVLICCVVYPLALWGFGRAFFQDQAAGSLIDENGEPTTDPSKARGSRLIGQPFGTPGYFQPRQSAAGNGYDASQSGGSNLAASNPLLRDRVARQLGPMVRFTDGKPVGPAVQAWFVSKPGYLATWAKNNPTLAQRWVKDDANRQAVLAWMKGADAPSNKGEADALLDDLAVAFFERFAGEHPTHWPVADKEKLEARPVKQVEADEDNVGDLQGVMFDPWLTANADRAAEIRKVPADMVLASGSGLDPHITLRNANYQKSRVIEERVKAHVENVQAERVKNEKPKLEGAELGAAVKKIEPAVEKLVNELIGKHSFTPMWGLAAGDPLVNVLELNLALDAAMTNFKSP